METIRKYIEAGVNLPWVKIAWEVWILLLLGYLWVIGSHIFCSSVESKEASGSILVAASLMAQLLYENLDWRKELTHLPPGTYLNLTGNGSYYYTEVRGAKSCNISSPFRVTTASINPSSFEKTRALFFYQYRFPLLMDMGYVDTDDDSKWYYQKTKRRVEYWLTSILAISMFFGTVVWGYGVNIYMLVFYGIWLFATYLLRPGPFVRYQ